MDYFKIDGRSLHVRVLNNPRAKKTVRIDIESSDTLSVHIPSGYDLDVETLLEKHRDLIKRKYEEYCSRINILEGDGVLFKGKRYRLDEIIVEEIENEKVVLSEDNIQIHYHRDKTPLMVLKRWMSKETNEIVEEVIRENPELGEPKRYSVTDTARWGYTNDRGIVIYNWQLSALPEHLARYVIIHELVHLEYMNHQKGFKSRLIHYHKDFKKLENELNKYRLVLND